MKRWIRSSWVCLFLGLCWISVGCNGDAEVESESSAPEADSSMMRPPTAPVPEDPPADPAPPRSPLSDPMSSEMNMMAPALFQARFTTSKGVFVIEAHREWSPAGVDRFFNLVRHGFYDEARFFRVLDGFMAQFGINGDPTIQRHWRGANISDDSVVESNTRGRVTFAKSGAPNSRSTQLFINFGDNGPLDRDGFSPIGEVVEGMDVVDRLYSGYGEAASSGRGSGPEQNRIQSSGNQYLKADFPNLDYIERAEIIDGD